MHPYAELFPTLFQVRLHGKFPLFLIRLLLCSQKFLIGTQLLFQAPNARLVFGGICLITP